MSGERMNVLRFLLATIFLAPWDYPFTFVSTQVAGVGKGRGKGNVGARFNACENSLHLRTSNTQATLLSWRLPGALLSATLFSLLMH